MLAKGIDRAHYGVNRAVKSTRRGDRDIQRCLVAEPFPELLDQVVLLVECQELRHNADEAIAYLATHLDTARAPLGKRDLGVLSCARAVFALIHVEHQHQFE